MKTIGHIALAVLHVALAAWGTLALYFSYLPAPLRYGGAGLFAAAAAALLFVRPKRKGAAVFVAMFAAVLIGWLCMEPSNHRNWQPDVAVLPWAEIQGNKVTIHKIRNNDYRSETDYTVHHYDKTFDLDKLKSVDLSLVYWGSPSIAHTMFSFGFEGEGTACISIETRKEVCEAYSTIKGFFRQYELTYVVADERDLIGLRTNYRVGEDVYLYRLKASADLARKVFLDYLREVNSLKERPEWYNALTGNCTTSIRGHIAPYNPDARPDWRLIVNGYIDEMLYERKTIDTSLPFAELKKRSLINEKARALDKSPDFSQRIRAGLPGMEENR